MHDMMGKSTFRFQISEIDSKAVARTARQDPESIRRRTLQMAISDER